MIITLCAVVGATAGGSVAWWLGSQVGLMTGYVASVVGTAAGGWWARRWAREYWG